MKLTQKRLKEVLHYNAETGVFTRLIKTSNRIKVGDAAGSISSLGYVHISIDGQKYYSHRLAFLYVTGSFPGGDTDHINTKKIDNRWCNLRLANRTQNMANSKIRKLNTSGFKGVSWFERDKNWRARIQHKGKEINLGYFDTKEKAHAAYMQAAKRLFGEYARVA